MSCPQSFQSFIEYGPYINSNGEDSISLPGAYQAEEFREWFLENGIYLGPVEELPDEVINNSYATHSHSCYANAQKIALEGNVHDYYEGFLFISNISRNVLHGFNVKDGNAYDFTLKTSINQMS